MKHLIPLLFFLFGFAAQSATLGEELGTLPIQDSGRIKPLDTFARESLQLIYGKAKYQGREAVEVLMTLLLVPEHWQKTEFIELRHAGVKQALELDKAVKYVSPDQMFSNPRIRLVFQELQNLRERKEKLNPYYQAVQRLENQLSVYQAIQQGKALRLAPQAMSDTWVSIDEMNADLKAAFLNVTREFVAAISTNSEGEKVNSTPAFHEAVQKFHDLAKAQAPEKYGDEQRLKIEVHYNEFRPFQKAWICYLIGILFLLVYMVSGRSWANAPSWIFLIAGFLLHIYGLALRVYLAGRPPVSNMYETVVWVPLGTMFFGFVLGHIQKNRWLLLCSGTVAMFCLILTDLSPTVLDGAIQPLEPVLRSTFWLTTHVLIITISYAAFFLAFAIGDLVLVYTLRDEKKYAKEIHQGVQSIYRSVQIGIVLLAFGIILGGIWADYSWGRFWGWDPKETWALIALLGYIALLHGRLAGWVKNYQLAAGAVVAFSLVIMSWYGVNFVLGAGLHSYGFGAGGVEYVAAFVVAHLCFVAYVTTVRYGRLKQKLK
jgi:cytochrome c-type biogenesis protein CcsB